ncbi:TPA: enoyl-CoA hydratase/isomerase family protein [Pseudomonas putida]|uniref:enoyl-CoA hydratase/isomerase family protein n=1 Tax=Pseudomonas putida TaxID=303 RepID=UPI00192D1E87|nr:enoyl-CoA hydratase/isomerase family protein [Pseudomonas putida]HDS0931705.1 enoyl-CoA hydratase/isomerase family protein [Pseudomonas putida]HDS3796982.1 enoyl-CoA hydratase/isomerase family protein [Pseudomonas putida]
MTRIFQYPRPTVAAINGHAIAGGLITALDCDFRIAARKPAKFGLNEVPIGIPMPAAYVEIVKYALGNQAGALTTLKGELYSLEKAENSASSMKWSKSQNCSRGRSPTRVASLRIATD